MNEHTATEDHSTDTSNQMRITSPMQPFGMSAVTTGVIITLIGIGIIFGIPLLLA